MMGNKPKMKAISSALSQNAKKLVCLMRMCTVAPQSVLTNLCAVSHMTSLDYFIGNWGMLPCDLPVIYLGASVSDIAKLKNGTPMGPLQWAMMIIGAILVVVIVGVISYYANKEFKRSVAKLEEEKKMEEN
jgi:hypothetical protein